MKCAPAFIYWHMNTNLHLVNRCKFAFFLLLLIGFYFYSFFLSILPSVRCATFGFSRIRFVFTNRGLCVFLVFPRFLSPSPPLSVSLPFLISLSFYHIHFSCWYPRFTWIIIDQKFVFITHSQNILSVVQCIYLSYSIHSYTLCRVQISHDKWQQNILFSYLLAACAVSSHSFVMKSFSFLRDWRFYFLWFSCYSICRSFYICDIPLARRVSCLDRVYTNIRSQLRFTSAACQNNFKP